MRKVIVWGLVGAAVVAALMLIEALPKVPCNNLAPGDAHTMCIGF